MEEVVKVGLLQVVLVENVNAQIQHVVILHHTTEHDHVIYANAPDVVVH